MKQGSLVLGVGFVAAVAGGLVGWSLAPSRSATEDGAIADDALGGAEAGHKTELVEPPTTPPPDEGHTPRREEVDPGGDTDLIGEALRDYARAGIARGWASQRSEQISDSALARGMGRFEEVVLEAPEAIGRELAARQDALDEARQIGEAFVLFLELEEGEGPMVELASDADRFDELFAPEVGESIVDGARPAEELLGSLVDGTTLSFGAGVFRLDLQELLDKKRPFPRDVTVAGAGRAATLLVLSDLSVRSPLRNLTIRDCTVYTDNGYLFDLRSHGAVLRFDRVHFTGFDSGAGGSSLLNLRANAVYATGCIIEGGYGRSPGSGVLFDVRTDAHLARFEDCELVQLSLRPGYVRAGATVLFDHCFLRDILDPPGVYSRAPEGFVLHRSPIQFFDRDAGSPPAKDLNDLFPRWREALR